MLPGVKAIPPECIIWMKLALLLVLEITVWFLALRKERNSRKRRKGTESGP